MHKAARYFLWRLKKIAVKTSALGATIRLYKIGAGKNHFLCSEKSKSTVFDLDRETKKRKYAKETCRIYIEKDQNMQEEKKEKYINGEIYGEKNQIIVANKSAMIRDKMRSKSWDQRYLKEIINAKKIKITEEMAEKVLDRTGWWRERKRQRKGG